MINEDYLMHTGRKGMKWYQHIFTKDKETVGRSRKPNVEGPDEQKPTNGPRPTTASGKKSDMEVPTKLENGSKQGKTSGKRSIKDIPDDEMHREIKRAQLEAEYKKYVLDPETQRKKSAGKEFTKRLLAKGAENIGQQLVTYAMGASVNAVAKRMGASGPIVNPKKGQKDK